jgi:nicotinamidase-related amidase
MSTPWHDRPTLGRRRLARRMGLGRRPAVLVIDTHNRTVGDPNPCDDTAWQVVSTWFMLVRDGSDVGFYRGKPHLRNCERLCLAAGIGAQLTPLVPTVPGDVVLAKTKFSTFTGTPLLGLLVDRRADRVVVGCSLSNYCGRAIAIAAAEHNLRVIIPVDAMFNRVRALTADSDPVRPRPAARRRRHRRRGRRRGDDPMTVVGLSRDLVGSILHPSPGAWANDARVTLSVVLNIEEAGERTRAKYGNDEADGETPRAKTDGGATSRSSRCSSTCTRGCWRSGLTPTRWRRYPSTLGRTTMSGSPPGPRSLTTGAPPAPRKSCDDR